MKGSLQKLFAVSIAIGTVLSGIPGAYADPGDVNSVNTSQTVQGGTYYNTPGDKTVFTNANGLWIQSGVTVKGLEVSDSGNPAGSLTNNGGWLHFHSPNGIVRVDGTIDVNSVISYFLPLFHIPKRLITVKNNKKIKK